MAKRNGKKNSADKNGNRNNRNNNHNNNKNNKNNDGGGNGSNKGNNKDSNSNSGSIKNGSNGAFIDQAMAREKTSKGISTFWVLFMAVISFGMGVLTPPSIYLAYFNLKGQSGSQRKLTKSTTATTTRTTSRQSPKNLVVDCNDEELLAQYFHDEEVPGMHLLCIKKVEKEFRVKLYAESVSSNPDTFVIEEDVEEHERLTHLFQTLTDLLDLDDRPVKNQPWALFTRNGFRLVGQHDTISLKRLAREGLLLLIEGGQWVWPGVREGFRRTVDLSYLPGSMSVLDTRNATIETLSMHPLVLSVEGFLSDDECDHIQEEATPRMRYSEVSLMDQDKGRSASDFRTSKTAFLSSSTAALKAIDARTASLVRIPVKHQEHVQVLRYGKTEKYDAHHDYFDPAFYQNDPSTLRMIANGRKNRMATVFWYLSDVEEGGETNFPRHNRMPQPHNMVGCKQGLKVKPQRGKVIIFYSMTPDGALDEYSLHAACPVKEGVKWAANKWVWNAPL